MLLMLQTNEDGSPTNVLTGDSLTACEKIGSTAKTIEEAEADPKVLLLLVVITLNRHSLCLGIRILV